MARRFCTETLGRVSCLNELPCRPRSRFRLFIGLNKEGTVRAILNTDDGPKLRVQYGRNFATITPEDIVQPPGERDAPKDVEFLGGHSTIKANHTSLLCLSSVDSPSTPSIFKK